MSPDLEKSFADVGFGVRKTPARQGRRAVLTGGLIEYPSEDTEEEEQDDDDRDFVPPHGRTRRNAPGLDRGIETRSLNLVCYREGQQGCKSHQMQVARWRRRDRDASEDDLLRAVAGFPLLNVTDEALMQALRRGYENKMCGFWRRIFSLKSLRFVRLRSVILSSLFHPVV